MDWDYDKGVVDVSMTGYIDKVLPKFQHVPPAKEQHAPYKWVQPAYGKKTQYTPEDDDSSTLDEKDTKLIQAIVESLLYYSRAIDSPMLVALNEIATKQSNYRRR